MGISLHGIPCLLKTRRNFHLSHPEQSILRTVRNSSKKNVIKTSDTFYDLRDVISD